MRLRLFHCLFSLWFPASACCWAQEPSQVNPDTAQEQASALLPDAPVPNVEKPQEHPPRVFWIIPTYKVTESEVPTRLAPREKLEIVVRDVTDPYTIGYTGFMAGIAQANNDLAGYGQGAQGYFKRFGAGYADQASAGFFGGFLFPSMLHQDPRYYRQGSGPFTRRLAHALVRPVVTYTDADGHTVNWSGLLGGLAASGLSNAYYPEDEREAGKTFARWGTGIPWSVVDHLVDEFGPDLERALFGRKRKPWR